VIEADEHNQLNTLAITKFLETRGYDKCMREYERSYWCVNDNFYEIYKGLALD
jgi:hypothetical protein